MKNLDWANLSFGYRPTDYNVRCYYRDGKWGEIEICSDEYLKLLALSRLYLDNVPHIEVSLLGMGLSLGELGLHAGADDINSIVIEENVLKNHGVTTIEEAESFIKNAGFTPYRRSLNFD